MKEVRTEQQSEVQMRGSGYRRGVNAVELDVEHVIRERSEDQK